MAISGPLCNLLREVGCLLPRGGSLLEIGEANWYGDTEPDFVCSDKSNGFAICKDFYADLFAPEFVVSVDAGGTKSALRFDLNNAIALYRQFDVVINHGTAEHIFNVGQVFKTIHDACDFNGVMIHDAPFTGWLDHGFYCFQPTLFYDIARANCYEVAYVAAYEIKTGFVVRVNSREEVARLQVPQNCNLFVVFRKRVDLPFKLPMQGYYARNISEAAMQAWEVNR